MNGNFFLGFVRQPDHQPRQIDDLHRLAHVEHEDVAAFPHQPRLQHELRGFGNGHEVAHDLRVGHGDRPAGGDLRRKARHHAAARSQHIAEAHRAAMRFGVLRGVRLQRQLGQPLARAHHIGRVHRLVGGDEHEALRAAGRGRACRAQRAQHIGAQRLDGVVVFHQRHMLVGRGVQHHGGAVPLEQVEQPLGFAHIGGVIAHGQLGKARLELLLQRIDGDFRGVDAHQLPHAEARDLAAQLRADAAPRTRDQRHLPGEQAGEAAHVELHRGAPQQVGQLDLARRLTTAAADAALQPVVGARQGEQGEVRIAGLQQQLAARRAAGLAGDQRVAGALRLRHPGQIVHAAGHPHALHAAAHFAAVRADEGGHLPALAGAQALQRARGLVERAQHQQRLALRGRSGQPSFGQNARAQPQAKQRGAREQRMQQHDGAREIGQAQEQQHGRQRQRRHDHGRGQPLELGHAGVPPRRAVNAQTSQRRHPHHGGQRRADPQNLRQVDRRVIAQQAEAKQEGEQPGEGDEQGVGRRGPPDRSGRKPHAALRQLSSRPRATSSHTRARCAALMFEPEGRQTPPSNSARLTS